MALYWDWEKDKIAAVTYDLNKGNGASDRYTVNWYSGNAWMIEAYENLDNDAYTIRSYWTDKEHMLRCLGLRKGYGNIYDRCYDRPVKVRLLKSAPHFKEIAAALAQAFDYDFTIEICTEL